MLLPEPAKATSRSEPAGPACRAAMMAACSGLGCREPSSIVFDHMGRIAQPDATRQPGYQTIRKLLDQGRTWVKLSGAYMETKVGPPSYADTTALAQELARAAPERMIWGSDWPHPTRQQEKPDDAVLFDLLAGWVPEEATRTRMLVENPETLYGFTKLA